MPREHLSMRKIFEVLRLRQEQGLSCRKIAAACGIGVGTVHEYLRRAREAGLSWAWLRGKHYTGVTELNQMLAKSNPNRTVIPNETER